MKVGDYVRTKDGIIAKITDIIEDLSIDCDRDVFDLDNMAMMEIPWNFKDEYIIKSKPNPIDLIEVGDILRVIYDNKEFVCRVTDRGSRMVLVTSSLEISLGLVDIKSIVTKECFESMEYKIKE